MRKAFGMIANSNRGCLIFNAFAALFNMLLADWRLSHGDYTGAVYQSALAGANTVCIIIMLAIIWSSSHDD